MKPTPCLICFVLAACASMGATPAAMAISPPGLVSPSNGEILQLSAPPNTLTLVWGKVADATGYLVTLEGPESFGDPITIPVEQAAGNQVSQNVNNFTTGIYSWKVASLLGNQAFESAPSFFTVQTGQSGGGNLPAPAILLLPDRTTLRGDSWTVHFQWTRVNGAKGYRLSFEGPLSGSFQVPQPSGGSTVVSERGFPPAAAGRYVWSVTPYDNQDLLGEGTEPREFILTPVDGQPWDLDESQLPSPGDIFLFSSRWMEGFSVADLDSDGETDAIDLLSLLQTTLQGPVPDPTPIPGLTAPIQIQPSTNTTVSPNNVEFIWQPIVGAVGYELNILDSNPNSNIVKIIEQPGSGTASTTIGYLPPRPRKWRIRAFFGAGGTGPYSHSIPFNVAN
ncbi:MAG: hypothetical protein IT394_09485 [Candidatus Omnitrophica bacterium]|nr:hypothetical protein [Candidatus Omnitrophota bacterium]